MRTLKLTYIIMIIGFIIGCKSDPIKDLNKSLDNYSEGIDLESYEIISEGPKSIILKYFDHDPILRNRITSCKILQGKLDSNRIAKYVLFDTSGNMIFENNDFFFHWAKGTYRSTMEHKYDSQYDLIEIKGIYEENSTDSIQIKYNYDSNKRLVSKEYYKFSRPLKENVEGDLLTDSDFEKNPIWHLTKTENYYSDSESFIIQYLVNNEVTGYERYLVRKDSLGRLAQVNNYHNYNLISNTKYFYNDSSITSHYIFYYNGVPDKVNILKVHLDSINRPIERIVQDEFDTVSSKTEIHYNSNGTIKYIKRGDTYQIFEYEDY